jgi:hypothetical protein
MTMILVLAVALAVGVSVHSRWVMVLPVAAGGIAVAVLALMGQDLSDTPIPFVVVMSTVAVAAANLARSRLMSA